MLKLMGCQWSSHVQQSEVMGLRNIEGHNAVFYASPKFVPQNQKVLSFAYTD